MSILPTGVVPEIERHWVGDVRRKQSTVFFEDETICTREVSPTTLPFSVLIPMIILACAVRIMRQANSEMFERKVKAEKDCRKLSTRLKDHERKSIEKMEHACEKIRKANKRDMEVAVMSATVGLENALKKSVRGAKGLKRNVAQAQDLNATLFKNLSHSTRKINELELLVKKVGNFLIYIWY